MSASSAPSLWRINPCIDLHWRSWDEESVAFDRVSGQMVACDPLEAALMACLEAGLADLDQIHTQLAVDLGVDSSPELAARLRAIIDDFVLRGWVQPA